MIKYMLDTDISIYTIKRKPLEVRRMFNIHSGKICISSVTLGELIYGAENSKNRQQNLAVVEGFVARVEILNYDVAAAYQFGQMKQELKSHNIDPYDLMIASHARSLGLTLISNNLKEFNRVDGLRLDNWVTSE